MGLVLGEFPCKQFAIYNTKDSLVIPKFRMNVRNVMLFVICVIHTYDNAIKHGEDWHNEFSCFDYSYF